MEIHIVWEYDLEDQHVGPRNHGYFSSMEKVKQYCDVTAISGRSTWHIETVKVQ